MMLTLIQMNKYVQSNFFSEIYKAITLLMGKTIVHTYHSKNFSLSVKRAF
jgi:hypothetical protein